jgi:Cys-rich four helix bundle protein (predicted Tat secretion target)
MNRRDALLTTSSMLVSASLGSLACGGATATAQNAKALPPTAPASASLTAIALDCLAKGSACVSHCLGLLGAGDTSMAGCARTSFEMTSVMETLATLSASGSSHLPAYARLASDFCRDCAGECSKHAERHAVCKDCLDACQRAIAACQAVAG